MFLWDGCHISDDIYICYSDRPNMCGNSSKALKKANNVKEQILSNELENHSK